MTPRTDKLAIQLLGRPLHEAYKEMTEFARSLERRLLTTEAEMEQLKTELWERENSR